MHPPRLPERAGDEPLAGAADEMAMDPRAVGRASRDWDEQHVDLRAAASQVAEAPVAGFTPTVAGAAADFLRAWGDHVGAVAELSEQQADALREVMTAWVHADRTAVGRAFVLGSYLEELR